MQLFVHLGMFLFLFCCCFFDHYCFVQYRLSSSFLHCLIYLLLFYHILFAPFFPLPSSLYYYDHQIKRTYHPDGAASLYSGCRPCPPSKKDKKLDDDDDDDDDDPLLETKLGRSKCDTIDETNETMKFVHGDLDGDGELSEREALRLLYTYTIGKHWGLQFESWGDPTVNKCDLNGVTCNDDGDVGKIDLTDASMCINGDRKPVPMGECLGIPAEISKLSKLEILAMNRRPFLRGTLPRYVCILFLFFL